MSLHPRRPTVQRERASGYPATAGPPHSGCVQVLPRRIAQRRDGDLVVERTHVEDLSHILAEFVLKQDLVQQVSIARDVRLEIPCQRRACVGRPVPAPVRSLVVIDHLKRGLHQTLGPSRVAGKRDRQMRYSAVGRFVKRGTTLTP